MIACEGGTLNGQWFTEEEWDTRIRAHQRMRDVQNYRSRGALDYDPTPRTIDHPQGLTDPGQVYTYKWK